MDNTLLTYQIIKRIFVDIGITKDQHNNNGIVHDKLKLDKTVSIKYDEDKIVKHDIYAGEILLSDHIKVRGLVTNLSIQNISEYLFVFQLTNQPIYCAHIVYDDGHESYLKIYKHDVGKWFHAPLFMLASILSGFEKINDLGILWQDTKDIDDLYNLLISYIESGL